MENFNQKKELIKESIKEIENLDFIGNQDKVDIILTYKNLSRPVKLSYFFKPGYKSYSEQDFKANIGKAERIFKNLSLPYDMEISKESDLHVAIFYIGRDNECLDKIKKPLQKKVTAITIKT